MKSPSPVIRFILGNFRNLIDLHLKKYFRKGLKILLWTIASIIGLFLLVLLLIQVPYVQNKIKDKAVTYLEGKIHTKVVIGNIDIGFPKNVILEKVYLEDQKKDTLLYGDKLEVNISLFKLIDSNVEINSIDLNGITAHVSRSADSIYNFDYIINAFATKDKPEDNSKPTKISLNKINLDKIKVKFKDEITKNDLNFYVDHFDTRIKKFDLDKTEFDIPKIKLDGLNVRLKQGELLQEIAETTVEVADSLAKKTNIKLKLGDIALSKIKVSYDNAGTRLNTGMSLGQSLIRFNKLDIQNQIIDLESLDIKDFKGNLVLGQLQKKTSKTPVSADTVAISNPWKIKLNQANLKEISFRFDDINSAPAKKGIDYKHLNIKNFNLDGEKFNYTSKVISGNIYAFTMEEQSGLHVQSMKTEFYYGEKTAYLKKLYVKTPQTVLRDQIVVNYPSIESLQKNIGELDVTASLVGSQVGFKDILIFAPDLAGTNPFKSNPEAIMKINSRISGKVSDIEIPNLEISGIGSTKIAASGRITGLPDTKNAYFDLNIRNFESSSKDINGFVPPKTIPNTIQLPAHLAVRGTFKGKMNDFLTDLNINTTYGSAKIKANFDQKRKNYEKYQADAELRSFDIGKLIKNKDVGKISLKAKVNGIGLNPKTANAKINGKITSANYNKYTYRNGNLKGAIKNGNFDATVVMKDPNLAFDLDATGSFKDKYPAVKIKLNMDIVDLEKLNLHAGPLKLKGQMEADIPTADPDYLNGTINLHHLRVANAKEEFAIDTIAVTAVATAEKNAIAVASPMFDATMEGKYKLTTLADALTNSIAKYYDTKPSSRKIKTGPQQVAFRAIVKNHPVIFQLLPELKDLQTINISGRYNTVNDSIVLNANIPKVIYGTNNISNAVVKVDTQDGALVYGIVVDDIRNSQFQLPYTNLYGTVKDNVLAYTLQLKDVKSKERYLLAGNLKSVGENTEIHLNENLVLNYEAWNMVPDHRLRIGRNGVYANNFVLSKDGSSIALQSQSEAPNAPLAVTFKDFKIETITSIIEKDSLKITGNINGDALIKDLAKSPLFTADMKVTAFTFNASPVGDLSIKVNNASANTYIADIALTGQDNNVKLDGSYRADTSTFDMDLDMQKLNLKSIEGFTQGNLAQSSGFLSGKFKIQGTSKDPNINGALQFNDVAFRVTQFNSYFKSINEKVVVDNTGIVFDKFTITDEENNTLIVDGKLATTNFSDYGFDMTVRADNFRALNSKEKDNQLYYGQLYLNSRLNIKGDLNKPVIDGRIKLNKDTKLTIVLPQSDPAVEDREGIVEFIDQDNPVLETSMVVNDSISKSKFKGIDASVNIEIDKEAELSLIIDKGNGDYLKLRGEARLNGGIDPSGKTTLTGRYEFTEGTYEMTFNLIKRKFDIKEGSYILWTGEPRQADISITAVYKTEAPPIDLVGDQLGAVTPEVRNTYKQKIPFETNLIMKGELLKPDITFDIVLPEGNNTVSTEIINNTQTKLAQLRQEPAELNKQVFALLLLNRFIGENPFASEAGGTSAEALARQSVSKILSQQLNNLASDLIKGVELDFDLESSEDYTSGQKQNKTDLNVGVSKRLLNDRLKVTVGSSFGLEGQQQANQEANTIAGDLSADYSLSKDGRYRLRAYRKNQYQVALQGQVIETGVAFIITMNYDKFKELFHRSKEEKRAKRAKLREQAKLNEEARLKEQPSDAKKK
jgi:hypothetical protein